MKKVMFRPVRGSFADATKAVCLWENEDQILAHLKAVLLRDAQISELVFQHVGLDVRNGWDTYMVCIKSGGVIGYANGDPYADELNVEPGTRMRIPVSVLEYDEGGKTLWVHSHAGFTVLRIKTTGITTDGACTNLSSHADMVVDQTLVFCVPAEEPDYPMSAEMQVICHLLAVHEGRTDPIEARKIATQMVSAVDVTSTEHETY